MLVQLPLVAFIVLLLFAVLGTIAVGGMIYYSFKEDKKKK